MREGASKPRGHQPQERHTRVCAVDGPGPAAASSGLPASFDDAPLKIHQQKQKVSMHFTESTFFMSYKHLWI